MKKKILIIALILVLLAGRVTTFFVLKSKKENCNTQAIKFKEEYEKYNRKEITYNNKKYKLNDLSIDKDNPMNSINKSEIYDKLTTSTTIIFFTSPEDYTSREMLKVLLEVSKDNNCDTIYYYDVTKLNENYLNDEDTELYDEITNLLGEKLSKTFDDDTSRSGNKKIENGTIIFVKEGEVKTVIEEISDDYEYGSSLTEKQERSLKSSINKGFTEISGGVCEIRQQC